MSKIDTGKLSALWLFFIIWFILPSCKQQEDLVLPNAVPYLSDHWDGIDSLLLNMSLPEKIGQLVFWKIHAKDSATHIPTLFLLAENGALGGVILDGFHPNGYKQIIDSLKKINKIPVLLSTNQRVLLNNQFSGTIPIPSYETMASIANDSLSERVGQTYLRQLEVNKIRSYFMPPSQLADKSLPNSAIGAQAYHFLAYAEMSANEFKFFGDSVVISPSHQNDLFKLVNDGVPGFYFKDLPVEKASTLFSYFRDELFYDGMLIVECKHEDFAEQYYLSGADVLFMEKSPTIIFTCLDDVLSIGGLSISTINRKVKKMLLAKKWVSQASSYYNYSKEILLNTGGDDNFNPSEKTAISPAYNLEAYFFDQYWSSFSKRSYRKSIVLLNDPNQLIPKNISKHQPSLLVTVGARPMLPFKNNFNNYSSTNSIWLRPKPNGEYPAIDDDLKGKHTVIVAIGDEELSPSDDFNFFESLRSINRQHDLVLVVLGNTSVLKYLDKTFTVIYAAENNEVTQSTAAQGIFGGVAIKGKSARRLGPDFPSKMGMAVSPLRLSYSDPEDVGISSKKLVSIDAIVNSAIKGGAMPGCQVLIAKKGQIIYSKSFGYHTYQKQNMVDKYDLYDIASVTKIAATTMGIMERFDKNKLKLKTKIKSQIACSNQSTIKNISVKELLTHQSGLQPNMPVVHYLAYRDQINNQCDSFFCHTQNDTFSIKVAENFYFNEDYLEDIWKRVEPVFDQEESRFLVFRCEYDFVTTNTGRQIPGKN